MKNIFKKKNNSQEKIILGIDPGTNIMGFGLIKSKGFNIEFIEMNEIILNKKYDSNLRLKEIFEKILLIIDKFFPNELAIESSFLGKNIQSMLKLGRAQGVIIAAGLYRNIPITEYSPKKIKMSITGNGNSSKEQVSNMLNHILKIKKITSLHLDASDALAVAICHHLNKTKIKNLKKYPYKGWNSFIKKNIKRIN